MNFALPLFHPGALARLVLHSSLLLNTLAAAPAARGVAPESLGTTLGVSRVRIATTRDARKGSKSQWATPQGADVWVTDTAYAHSIERLVAKSPAFRVALDSIRALGYPILVGSIDEYSRFLPDEAKLATDRWLAYYVPEGGRKATQMHGFVVVMNAPMLRRQAERAGQAIPWPRQAQDSARAVARESMLDEVLLHEIFGHVAPVAYQRRATPTCEDAVLLNTVIHAKIMDACVEQRMAYAHREMEFVRQQSWRLAEGRPAAAWEVAPSMPDIVRRTPYQRLRSPGDSLSATGLSMGSVSGAR
jgi:hypothetical protein